MSYILDALTKSQQQRRPMEVPRLDSAQLAAPATPARRGHLWNAALVTVAAAGAAYGIHAHFYAPGPASSDPPRASTAAAEPVGAADRRADISRMDSPHDGERSGSSPRDAPRQAKEHPEQQKADAAQDAPAISAARDAGPGPMRTTDARESRPARASPSRATTRQASSRGNRSAKAAPMAQPPANALDALLPQAPPPQNHRETERLRLELTRLLQEESAPASGPTAAPPTQPDTPSVLRAAQTPALSASLPALSELPPAVRQELGALKMNAHLYSQVPAERVVVINMQRYREGDRLGSGPRVEAITPRGAVLSLASRRFRIDVR